MYIQAGGAETHSPTLWHCKFPSKPTLKQRTTAIIKLDIRAEEGSSLSLGRCLGFVALAVLFTSALLLYICDIYFISPPLPPVFSSSIDCHCYVLLAGRLLCWLSAEVAACLHWTYTVDFPRDTAVVFSFHARLESEADRSSPIISRKPFLVRNCGSARWHISSPTAVSRTHTSPVGRRSRVNRMSIINWLIQLIQLIINSNLAGVLNIITNPHLNAVCVENLFGKRRNLLF